VINTALA
jgi:hypothetical protein